MTAQNQPVSAKTDFIAEAATAVKRFLVQAGLFSCVVNILMLTGPIYMLQMYDRVLSSRSVETLVVITVLTFALFLAMGVLDFARGALLARSAAGFEATLKPMVYNLAMDKARAGQVSDQPLKDLRSIRTFVASPALTAIFDAPWTPIYMLIIFLMHWMLGLVALAGMAFLLALAFLNESASRVSNLRSHAMNMDAERLAMSTLRNAAATDSMGMRPTMRHRWLELSGLGSIYTLSANDTIGGLTAATKALRIFLQSAILGAGAYLAIRGEVSPGAMIAASIIAGRALAPIEIVTSQWRNFAQNRQALKRLREFIEGAPATAERTALPRPQGNLLVSGLFCQPDGAKNIILRGVGFQARAGEAVGIIGPSASGKTTLARAIVGVEPIRAGDVKLDGASLSQWDLDALGKFIGYLPQEVELFGGTAAQNIARFDPEAEPTAIIAAAKAAGAHEMILALADGYDTEIGDRGVAISAGQRQRIGLARALYGEPSLVVLDEPNSNLDGEGDMALTEAVKGLKARGATVIIVAHRPSAIAFADKLLLLVGGEVKDFGPRDEILKKIAPQQVTPFRTSVNQTGGASGAA